MQLRDFQLLWTARSVSSLGSWLVVIAIPAQAFLLTGSLADTGRTLAAEYLPSALLGPLAGVVADRFDRRFLMLATDLCRATAVAAMLTARGPHTVWILYLCLIAESTGTVLFRAAAQAHTPVIVGTGRLLSSANALNALTDGTVRLVGGPLGAVLLTTMGFAAVIGVDAASYLVSAVAIGLTARTAQKTPQGEATVRHVLADLSSGLDAVIRRPAARALLPVTTVFLAANASLSAVLVPFGTQHLGGSKQTGLLLSALGIGFLLGAPVSRMLIDRVQPKLLLAATQAATAVGFFLLFHSSHLQTAAPAAVAVGLFGSITLVAPQTVLQRLIPNTVLGRVSAVFFTAEALATLLGATLGPAIAQATDMSTTATIASILTLTAAGLTCLLLPRLPLSTPTTANGKQTPR